MKAPPPLYSGGGRDEDLFRIFLEISRHSIIARSLLQGSTGVAENFSVDMACLTFEPANSWAVQVGTYQVLDKVKGGGGVSFTAYHSLQDAPTY